MARVTSEKTRQALLVVGDPLDPDDLPEKWQLFDDEGTPIAVGGGYGRTTITHQTDISLAFEESEYSEFDVHPGWRAFKVITNRPARVRVYASEAYQMAEDEIERPIGRDPVGDHGLLFELVTTVEQLSYTLSPVVDMLSGDGGSIFFVTITSLDEEETGTVQTIFHYTRIE